MIQKKKKKKKKRKESRVTVKLDSKVASRRRKTYSESGIKLQNLKFLKKILEKSNQFLPSEQPCEPKSLDFALKIDGVEKCARKMCARLWLSWRPFEF